MTQLVLFGYKYHTMLVGNHQSIMHWSLHANYEKGQFINLHALRRTVKSCEIYIPARRQLKTLLSWFIQSSSFFLCNFLFCYSENYFRNNHYFNIISKNNFLFLITIYFLTLFSWPPTWTWKSTCYIVKSKLRLT
jgi:hypothetical protein